MTINLSDTPKVGNLTEQAFSLGRQAREAASELAVLGSNLKTQAIMDVADALTRSEEAILEANKADISAAESKELTPAFIDRLNLTPERIRAMAQSVRSVAQLADPVGKELARWQVPSGLDIARVSVPLGVIGVIYESRPNVTVDASMLCIKAGNAVMLRGGSECAETNTRLTDIITSSLKQSGLPEGAVQIAPTQNRDFVALMLSGLNGALDVIVPRGGRSLVERVRKDARVPVFAHLEGICHTYLHHSADPIMARNVILNAKMRRTSICGALECLLVDRQALTHHFPPILEALLAKGCEIRGDELIATLDPRVQTAIGTDWGHEFGEAILAVKVVESLDEALAHIARYGSNHTDALLAEDEAVVARFFNEVDSAVVMHNTSTQFSDGGEFGFGAEIGIATGRMHARGPIGVDQLTCFKYLVRGKGQIRP